MTTFKGRFDQKLLKVRKIRLYWNMVSLYRYLVVAVLGVLLSPVFGSAVVLVGSPGLTADTLARVLGPTARIEGVTGSFFLVRETQQGRLDGTRDRLKRAGIKYVLAPDSATVDPNSLPSVRRHIEYVKATREIQARGADYRKSGGFFEALAYYLEPRVGPDGRVDQELVHEAARHRDQMPPAWLGGDPRGPGASFAYIGPRDLDVPQQMYFGVKPVSGRVTGIGWAPTNANRIYLSTAGGGVWKSTDQGSTWTFQSHGWQFLHTNCIAVHPQNEDTVLVGTGDYKGFFAAQTMGIMRSTDGGRTWTQVGTEKMKQTVITKIVYHPDNPNVVLALTGGPTGDIWRSTNGGLTWQATDAATRAWEDIDYGPRHGVSGVREFWAVSGNRSDSDQVVVSVNGGLNWTTVPDAVFGNQNIMDVACSKTEFGKVYVIYPMSFSIRKTIDSGVSWSNVSTANGFPGGYNWTQADYDMHLTTANYGSTEYLWCGLITLAVTTDEGGSWVDIGRTYQPDSRMHNDQHAFTPHPTLGYTGLAGGDGGVYRVAYRPGIQNTVTPLNRTLQISQFYHLSLHPVSAISVVMGGTQDNGTPASRDDLAAWKNLQGGDGGWSGFQPSDPSIHFTSANGGMVFRYVGDDDMVPDQIQTQWSSINFIAPLVYAEADRLLIGANNTVLRWNGTPGSWTPANNFGDLPRTLHVAPNNASRVYAGGNSGTVWRSNDGGLSFTRVDNGGLPSNVAIGAIAASWSNSVDVIVGIQRPTGGLFRCTSTTASSPVWTSVSGSGANGLPASPVNTIVRDPYQSSIWYVGTDVGLFMTTDAGSTWRNMHALGLPNVHVTALAIPPDRSYLYVATFGRGVWRIPLNNNTLTSFTLESSTVYGDQPTNGILDLGFGAPPGTYASISESSPDVITPTQVAFDTNATRKTFQIQTVAVSSQKSVQISATCLGTTRSATLTVRPYPTIESFLFLSGNYTYGGGNKNARVRLSAPAPLVGSFTFEDNSDFVSVVSPVTIAAGDTERVTMVSTVQVASVQTATVTARYKVWSRTATLTLYPIVSVTSLTLQPNPLLAGGVTQCTIQLSAPAPITTFILMSDDSPHIVTSTRVIQAGGQSLTFPIYGENPPADATVHVTARALHDPGPAAEANLGLLRVEVTDIDVTPNPIKGGTSGVLLVQVNRPSTVNRVISLSSSNALVASVPSGVSILAGATSATATVRTYSTAVGRTVTLTASYLGTSATTTLQILP